MRFHRLLTAFVLLIFGWANSAMADAEKYQIVATTGMIGDVVNAVAGPRAEVRVLIGPGTDPHLYNATRTDVAALSGADIIFYNGLHLEGRMGEVLERFGKRKPVHALGELVPKELLLTEDGTDATDPHLWMDVQAWSEVTKAATKALSTFDAANAAEYEARAEAYQKQLAQLHEFARAAFATIPRERRVLVTAHDAFRYLGHAYDVEVHGIQGISTESEAGLRDLNQLVDMLVARKIPAVFVESSVSDKNVKALLEGSRSRGHQVVLGGMLFSDAMGADGTKEGTYLGMIEHNVRTIVTALGGTAPEMASAAEAKP